MLYKVWQGAKDQYGPASLARWRYHDVPEFVNPDLYVESWNTGTTKFFGLWTTAEAQDQSVSQVYLLGRMASNRYIGGWSSHFVKYDGATGDLLWVDRSTYGSMLAFKWLSRSNFMSDDSNLVWSHYQYVGTTYLLRYPIRTVSANDMGGAAGMPDFNHYDVRYQDGAWLNEDGTQYWNNSIHAQSYTVHAYMGVSTKGDWAAIRYSGTRNTFAIHNLSDQRRRGYIRLRSAPLKGMVIDSETLYILAINGTIEVIDVPRLQNLGMVVFGNTSSLNLGWDNLGAGYDRVHRRLLTYRFRPDDPVTGACQNYPEGWALREVGDRLTQPLPLRAPKIGRSVPMIARVYGWYGGGVGGEQVTASLPTGNGAINPATKSADAEGLVSFTWVPDTEVTPPDADVMMTVNTVGEVYGLEPGLVAANPLPAPAHVISNGDEELLLPGFWLYAPAASRVRGQTLEQFLSPYLDDYVPTYDEDGLPTNDPLESPWRGVLVEYSWYEIETTAGNFNFTAMDADIAYAESVDLRVIIALRTSNPEDDGLTWVPNYIVDGTSGVHEESPTTPGMFGVFRPPYSTSYTGRISAWPTGFQALITDTVLAASYTGLISAIGVHYRDNDVVVGIAPIDHGSHDEWVFKWKSGVNYGAWVQARKDILQAATGNNKLIFEWINSQEDEVAANLPASHVTWCSDNGIGLIASKLPSDDVGGLTRKTKERIADAGPHVATGIALPSAVWSSTHDLDCYGNNQVFKDKVFNAPVMANTETGCSKYVVEHARPWMVFVDPAGGQWDVAETGMMQTVAEYRLGKEKAYNG